jgi:hypothetical protein
MFKFLKRDHRDKYFFPRIEEITNDRKLRLLFEEFCFKECSIENFKCYEDILLFENFMKDPIEIVSEYMKPDSPRQVNCQKCMFDRVEQKLVKSRYDETLFREVKMVVINNLCDTLSRFYSSEVYQQYLVSKKKSNSLRLQEKIQLI